MRVRPLCGLRVHQFLPRSLHVRSTSVAGPLEKPVDQRVGWSRLGLLESQRFGLDAPGLSGKIGMHFECPRSPLREISHVLSAAPPSTRGRAETPRESRMARTTKRGTKAPPELLTVGEVADWLRTTRKAIYAMVARGQLPGVVRIGRRVLFERQELISWLSEKRA